MPVAIADIAADLARGSIVLSGGRAVAVRALRASETALILAALPRPIPPMRKDITRGSNAPPIAYEDDPTYRREKDGWNRKTMVAEIAVAMDLEIGGKVWDRAFAIDASRLWIEDAVRALLDVLTESDIVRVFNVVADLGGDDADRARIRRSLILTGAEASEATEPEPMPETYAVTRRYVWLRICERYGMDPRTFDDTDPALLAVLEEQERIRQMEDAAILAAR